MPGGGAAYGKEPRDMGAAELALETFFRTMATAIIGVLFGSLIFNSNLDSRVRIFAATLGVPIFALFIVHSAACYREIWRRSLRR